MKLIKAASYMLTVISFARKIMHKISMEDMERIHFKREDDSDCWNIVIAGLPIIYSYDQSRIVGIARDIVANCKSIGQEIYLVENDELDSVSPTEFYKIPGISDEDIDFLSKLEY